MFRRTSLPSIVGVFRRHYSMQKPAATKRYKFDTSVGRPLVLLILVGSIAINIINQKKEIAEMEGLYMRKINKLQELVSRVRDDNDRNFSVEEELRFVNNAFSRRDAVNSIQNHLKAIHNSDLAEENTSHTFNEEESLDDVLKNIMDSVAEGDVVAKNKVHSVDRKQKPSSSTKSGIILNKELLLQEAEIEKEKMSYKPETEVHVIVERPGELVEAAKHTTESKFL
ncbi:HDR177Cp [Eremothecium sinecaudum]|uniref:HDR177Cp n=1 Tax=Eremothecium sinecaudum TaxID=45286 RepID=A0A0X8HT18_9SACH|nr:HDR177Cp [Eremothecium sinecaudum]AMD20919.1 HDR177Cp [Eremothecium sinecaudum]